MSNGQPPTQIVVPGQGWVDVASRVVVQVGFPVVVAGVLLWYVLGNFQRDMSSIVARMANNTDVVAKLISNEELMIREMQAQNEKLTAILDKAGRVLAIQEERQKYYNAREGKGQ